MPVEEKPPVKREICLLVLALLPSPPCLGDSSSDVYFSEIAKKCQKHYFPPIDPKTVSTVAGKVLCTIQCDGGVKNVRVVEGSKYMKTNDADALSYAALKEAIAKAAPFPKPPTELHCPVQIEVSFNKLGDARAKLQTTISRAAIGK
jgi:hypothetical protein